MTIVFHPIPTAHARALQAGAPDANGQPPEQRVAADGDAPCRHCLRLMAAGETYLVAAYRPFQGAHPYAETGPIFVHAQPCAPATPDPAPPAILSSAAYVARGYDNDERIVYGSGGVVDTPALTRRAASLLADPAIAFVDVRSASNGCFQCRIRRAS